MRSHRGEYVSPGSCHVSVYVPGELPLGAKNMISVFETLNLTTSSRDLPTFILICIQNLHLLSVCVSCSVFSILWGNLTNLVKSLLLALTYFLLCTLGVRVGKSKK